MAAVEGPFGFAVADYEDAGGGWAHGWVWGGMGGDGSWGTAGCWVLGAGLVAVGIICGGLI